MNGTSLAVLVLGLVAVGCGEWATTGPTGDSGSRGPQLAAGGIVHRVSVGSHDFVPPGVDANWSLQAIQYSDGRIMGEWSDQFGHSNGGLHVKIDCLHVVGNQAWLGGVATDKNFEGMRVITRIADNGTSTHEPPDQISFSVLDPAFFGLPEDCNAAVALPLFPLSGGEVKVY
jgi:hypothetical protein